MWDSTASSYQQLEGMSATEAVLGDGPQVLGETAFLMLMSILADETGPGNIDAAL
jgi:hypothetical protein